MPIDPGEMRKYLSDLTSILNDFAKSDKTFRIVSTLNKSKHGTTPNPSTLCILDSSFNPPTLAHLHIATSALSTNTLLSSRLLLLLSIQNADKAAKPASFPHRLLMMNLFAKDLLSKYPENSKEVIPPTIDICITKLPYFIDKAKAIEDSNEYPEIDPKPQQIHLIGFDTLTRLFSPKYYPPTHTLAPLSPFLSKHKLLVTLRPDDSWGSQASQEEWIRKIGEGSLDEIGGKREWRDKIEVLGGMKGEEDNAISSTRVREAVKKREGLKGLVTKSVGEWILEEGLYVDD